MEGRVAVLFEKPRARARARAMTERQRQRAADLVDRAREGDRAAFEALYREHAGRVHALCLRLTGDASRAEEHTQDAFVKAWRKLGAFRGDSAFSSWLHRIAVNTVLQATRAEKRRTARIEADPVSVESAGRAERPGLNIDLERAIAGLPEKARAVFVLHDIEGYKHSEIAKMTGTAVGTVKAQVHRARRLLRERLG